MFEFFQAAHAGVITDAPTLQQSGIKILNFLLSVAGLIAIIGLVAGAMLYLLAAGDEKKLQVAKKTLINSSIGIAIIMGGMIIVNLVEYLV